MQKRIFIIVFGVFFCIELQAQLGGKTVFQFLRLPTSARSASLGGTNVSVYDSDPNLVTQNPAILDSSHHNQLVMNMFTFLPGTKSGYSGFSRNISRIACFGAGIQYLNYGNMAEYDEIGNNTGSFHASETSLNIYASRKLASKIRAGVSLKNVFSYLDEYNSYAIAFDLGAIYFDPEKLFGIGLVAKNIGYQIDGYFEDDHQKLPLDIQLGYSQKFKHAPFRMSYTMQHLEQWDLTYKNTNYPNDYFDPFTGEEKTKSKLEKFSDNLLRHSIFSVEIVPTKNFFINIGYNHLRRKELALRTRGGMSGFSWGFGLKISKFQISYARATYSITGSSNHFSIRTDISQFKKQNIKANI